MSNNEANVALLLPTFVRWLTTQEAAHLAQATVHANGVTQ